MIATMTLNERVYSELKKESVFGKVKILSHRGDFFLNLERQNIKGKTLNIGINMEALVTLVGGDYNSAFEKTPNYLSTVIKKAISIATTRVRKNFSEIKASEFKNFTTDFGDGNLYPEINKTFEYNDVGYIIVFEKFEKEYNAVVYYDVDSF